MTDDATRSDGLADVINLLAAPIASGIRSVEQFRRGVDELFRAIENLNRTMENLNEAASRINRLLGDVEEPIRAMLPQVTRTVAAADDITKRLEGPVRAMAPNLERVIDTLGSPGFAALPHQLGEFMQAIGDVSRRLGPLTQFAENAGGLFGGFKLPGMASRPAAPSPRPSGERAPHPSPKLAPTGKQATATTGTPVKQATAKQATAKQATAKQATAKQATAKQATAKKAAPKRSTAAR